MMFTKKDKGTAGLTILLSVITMIFVIGLLVMIFSLMNAEVLDSDIMYDTTASLGGTNETISSVDQIGENLTVVNLRDVVCTINTVWNNSAGNDELIGAGNYTQTNCHLTNATVEYDGWDWIVNYNYTYSAQRQGVDVVNDTSVALGGTTDWFPLFIVITSMVVLILLTVIIITAIRSSGLMGGGSSGGSHRNVGHA